MKKYFILPVYCALIIISQVTAQQRPPREYVITHWNLDDGLPQSTVNSVIQTQDGYIWLATWGGLVRFDGVKFTIFDRSNSPGFLSDRAMILFEDKSKRLWIGTEQGLVFYYHGVFKTYTNKDGIENELIINIREDDKGDIWIQTGGDGLLYKLTGGKFILQNIISDELLKNRALKGEGGAWSAIGTLVIRFVDGKAVKILDLDLDSHAFHGELQGLSEEKLLPLCMRKNGTLLIGTNCGGIYEMPAVKIPGMKGEIIFSSLNKRLSNNCIYSIFEDSKERLWISSAGLVIVENNPSSLLTRPEKITFYTPANGFTGSFIWAIYEDKKGTIWIGCGNGLFSFSNNIFSRYTTDDGLSSNEVHSIYEDNDRNLWVGTINGLNKITGNKIQSFTAIENLKSHYIRAIYQDEDGVMWFGSYGGGIIRMKDNKFKVITAIDGLFDNIVSQIVEDDYQYLWMGSNRGISRVSRKELNSLSQTLSKKEGFLKVPSSEPPPHHLDQLGLTLAVESVIDKIADSSDIEITSKLEIIDGLIPHENEINFFRIIQESLNNIVKHSGATSVSIDISRNDNNIRLLIEDNGKGIEAEYLNGRDGSLGLKGMRERAKILHGEIFFSSSEKGTKVELIIPVKL